LYINFIEYKLYVIKKMYEYILVVNNTNYPFTIEIDKQMLPCLLTTEDIIINPNEECIVKNITNYYKITNYEFNYGNEWKKNDFLQKLPYNLGYFTTKYNYIYNRYDFVEDDIKITHEFITDSTIDSVKYNDYIKHKNLKHKFIISI